MNVTDGEAVVGAFSEINMEALKRRELCDSCLGRLVGKVGRGFTNGQRGCMIRERFELAVARTCWLCEGLTREYERFRDLIVARLQSWEFNSFLIGSKVDPAIELREEALWSEAGATRMEAIHSEINREVGKLVWEATRKEVDFNRPDVVAVIDTQFDHVELTISPLFTYGRYRKLRRGIPQTRWPCRKCRGRGCERCNGRGKMYETSVEEIIASAIMRQTGGSCHALHGMGREDVDALMLGRGRPFVLEISRPRFRHVDLNKTVEEINSSGIVEVSNLRPSSKEELVRLKEDRADKTYRVRLRFAEVPDEGKLKKALPLLVAQQIAQRTPLRVSHRRSDLVRLRRVRKVEVTSSEGRVVEMEVTAEAGTYVKELMHGDEGRTTPSLASVLGIPCEVLELDVTQVHDEV